MEPKHNVKGAGPLLVRAIRQLVRGEEAAGVQE